MGPSGSVLGIDLADRILAMARERAAEEGLTNLELRVLSAQELETLPAASFDVALCRWGLMYFDAPVDALVGVRRALTPDGVLVAAVLGEVERASYFSLPRRVLERYYPVPPINPEAPGSFHYGRPGKLRGRPRASRLPRRAPRGDRAARDGGRDRGRGIAWTRAFGMTRILDGAPEEIQQAWEADLAKAAEDLREPDGFIRLGAVSRIVVARGLGPTAHRLTRRRAAP